MKVVINNVLIAKPFESKKGNEMKIKPLADKVLVERVEAESVTSGGIVLPESAKEKPQRGKVISVGNGRLLNDGSRSKMTLKKGDMVLFTSYAPTEVTLDGKEYLIMDESSVMAVIK